MSEMSQEDHIYRQAEWQRTLAKFGKSRLQYTLKIRGVEAVADVYAEIDGREYIVEIGDVEDARKEIILQTYAERKGETVVLIQESCGENKIPQTICDIKAYRRKCEAEEAEQAYQARLKAQERD